MSAALLAAAFGGFVVGVAAAGFIVVLAYRLAELHAKQLDD